MIGIVIVSYKNCQGTIDFINNQLCKIDVPWKAVVIENSSDTESSKKIALDCGGMSVTESALVSDFKSDVYIIPSTENLGFARGNNLGADFLIHNFDCEYLLFTNDDIVIEDPRILSKLMDSFKADNDIAIVGPRVIGIDGKDQSPHNKIITPMHQIAWKLFPFRRRKKKELTYTCPKSSFCYWVSGCFFLARTSDFISVKGFDPATFLYSEEVILSERLRRIGKREFFYADSHVVHYGGCSTQIIPNKQLKKILKDSNSIYYRQYLHCSSLVVWLYRVLC